MLQLSPGRVVIYRAPENELYNLLVEKIGPEGPDMTRHAPMAGDCKTVEIFTPLIRTESLLCWTGLFRSLEDLDSRSGRQIALNE